MSFTLVGLRCDITSFLFTARVWVLRCCITNLPKCGLSVVLISVDQGHGRGAAAQCWLGAVPRRFHQGRGSASKAGESALAAGARPQFSTGPLKCPHTVATGVPQTERLAGTKWNPPCSLRPSHTAAILSGLWPSHRLTPTGCERQRGGSGRDPGGATPPLHLSLEEAAEVCP